MSVRLLPYGREAVLVELGSAADVAGATVVLRDLPGVLEVVPGARTVLVRTRAADLAAMRDLVPGAVRPAVHGAPAHGAEVTLDVVYDGADLDPLAAELGLTREQVVTAHAGARYVVAFCGFAPGFAYLTGLPEQLHAPRLAEPRTRVPAGSVAVAGEFGGVYPRASPGGWRLLGRTAATLWDTARTPPALLAPGTRVRFRDVT